MSFRLAAHLKTVATGLDPAHTEHAVNTTLHGLHNHGGSSVNLHGSSPEHGWMVGGFAREHAIKGGPNSVSHEHVRNYIHENAKHLHDKNNYLGSWHDEEGGKTTLDISRHFTNRDEAHAHARKHNEDAVYNLHEGVSEPTEWHGEKRPDRTREYD